MGTDDLFDSASGATEEPGGVRRDRWGRYLLPHPTSGREAPWTRVTTFCKTISDTFTLSQWSQRMVAKGLALRPDIFAMVAATPLEDRSTLNDLTEKAKEAAGAKSAASLGTALHSFTEAYDRGESPVVPDPWDKDVAAYGAALKAYGLTVIPGMIERVVINQKFGVAGTFDRIYMWRGRPVIGDLKTGRSLEYGWNEISIQLALYANADGIFDFTTGEYEPMPEGLDRSVGIVVHLPVGQAKATVYQVNLEQGYKAAVLAAAVRDWRKVRDLAAPVEVAQVMLGDEHLALPAGSSTEVIHGTVVTVREAAWQDRIVAARTVKELSEIRKEAMAAGEWTETLLQLGVARRDAILADTAAG
jgi:hypothetical protein